MNKSLLLVVVSALTFGCAPVEDPGAVSEETWTDGPWPLTVSEGVLSCEGPEARPVPWFTAPDDRHWPLNGIAMSEAQQRGEPYQSNILPIQKPDPQFADLPGDIVVRLSPARLRERAMEFCG